MNTWKRTIPIPQFRSGRSFRPRPGYVGSYLQMRDQFTSGPTAPYFDLLRPHLDPPNLPLYDWTPDRVVAAFQRMARAAGRDVQGLTCPQCGDVGRIRIDLAGDLQVGHPQVGHPQAGDPQAALSESGETSWQAWCLCELIPKVREHFEMVCETGFPYRPATFNRFKTRPDGFENESLAQALAYAMQYCSNPARWLVLAGQKGTGKTHLARAIATRLGEEVVLYLRVTDIISRCFSLMYQDDALEEYLARIAGSWFLILDDLNAAHLIKASEKAPPVEGRMPWAMKQLYTIIDFRYNNPIEFPTVITTNETLSELRGPLWDILGDRVADNHNDVIGMMGDSYRQSDERQEE
jgi:DNA replication protein DnaC